jgi:hypothetical protein
MEERHTSYSDEFIESGIKDVMKALNINRMPSRTEIFAVVKNHKLDNAIQRSYKYSGWAEKLGLELKESDTSLGKEYENIAVVDILENTGYESEKMTQNYPFDLLVADSIRVDVKASNRFYYNGKNYFHCFNLEKKFPVCDLFVCYCLDDQRAIERVFVIPSSKLHVTQLSIGVKSRYSEYQNSWAYFERYYEFYKSLAL